MFLFYKFQHCKQYVSVGISTSMSICDGLGPFISCLKMEKARPMGEEVEGKVVDYPPVSVFLTLLYCL